MLNSLLSKLEQLPTKSIYLYATLISMLLAAQIQYIQHGWINTDSVLYLEAAKLFANGQWQAGYEIFTWPLYSLLIAATHHLTSLSMHASAQLLTVIFFGITTFSFLKLIELANGTSSTLIAGVLILFSSPYLVGDVLEMLLRDHGFWAFFLTSLIFFIRYFKFQQLQDAFLWQIFAMISTLFRIEAISYLVFLPMIWFLNTNTTFSIRVRHYLKCNLINIFAIILILAILWFNNDLSMKHFGRLNEVFTLNFYQELTHRLFEKTAAMSVVLGKYLEDFALQGILLTFVYVLIAKTITATGLINTGLALFATKHRRYLAIDQQTFKVLSVVACIAFMNMVLIITKVFVLSGRYVLALSLILMIIAPFYLVALCQHLKSDSHQKKKWLVIALLLILLLSLINNILPKKSTYNYQQQAVSWVQENNPSNKPVFYDNARLRYYAGAPFVDVEQDSWKTVTLAMDNQSIQKYDFLMIMHSTKYPERAKIIADRLPEYREIKKFKANNSKNSLVIYAKQEK